MVESSRLVLKLLCVKLKSLNFDFKMDTTTQFNLHHKNEVDSYKNEGARVVTRFFPL